MVAVFLTLIPYFTETKQIGNKIVKYEVAIPTVPSHHTTTSDQRWAKLLLKVTGDEALSVEGL